uniref:FLYWCH-type domain-containing protein n=1 Tax=Heterorhabditis bacteriophora TaxID=37862 RepID=A0A1I7XL25_HETBA
MTARVLNGAFIDDPENPRRVYYCQPKSAARLLICRKVITMCNSQNGSTRTTNFVEGFHSKTRASYPTGTPSIDEMLTFCAAERTMAKTLAISSNNGSLKDRYIRPDDRIKYLKPKPIINPSACLTICAPLPALRLNERTDLLDLIPQSHIELSKKTKRDPRKFALALWKELYEENCLEVLMNINERTVSQDNVVSRRR